MWKRNVKKIASKKLECSAVCCRQWGGVGKAAQAGVAEIRSLKHETRVEQWQIHTKSADIKRYKAEYTKSFEY